MQDLGASNHHNYEGVDMADAHSSLTQDDVKKMFDYRDGNLYWKTTKRTNFIGKRVGYLQPNGYTRVNIKGNLKYLHRLIFLYHYGHWPKDQIDHIDGDPSNNRIENLREATNTQNNYNKTKYSRNTSGYKGVSWNKSAKKWEAYVTIDGERKYLGIYEDMQDAVQIASNARRVLHVEFAKD